MTTTHLVFDPDREADALAAFLESLTLTASMSVNGTLVPFDPNAVRNLAPGDRAVLLVFHSGRRGSVRRSDNQVNFTFWDETDADRI